MIHAWNKQTTSRTIQSTSLLSISSSKVPSQTTTQPRRNSIMHSFQQECISYYYDREPTWKVCSFLAHSARQKIGLGLCNACRIFCVDGASFLSVGHHARIILPHHLRTFCNHHKIVNLWMFYFAFSLLNALYSCLISSNLQGLCVCEHGKWKHKI